MTSPKPPTDNGSKIWIVAVVVVLVAGVAAVLLARGGSDDEVSGQTGTVQVGDGATTTSGDGETDTTAGDAGTAASLPQYDDTLEEDPAVGATIPTVTGTSFDGDEITIAPDGTAKVVLFVAHWCPHCQREVPLLKAYLDDNPMPDDVELITISTNVAANAVNYPPQEWLEREGWQATTIQDDDKSSIAAKFGLTSFPYFVAVDADGKVVQRTSGEISTDEFEALIAAAQG